MDLLAGTVFLGQVESYSCPAPVRGKARDLVRTKGGDATLDCRIDLLPTGFEGGAMFIATLELLLQLGKVPKWFNDEVVRMKAAHLVDKTVSAVHPVRTFGSRTGLLSMS